MWFLCISFLLALSARTVHGGERTPPPSDRKEIGNSIGYNEKDAQIQQEAPRTWQLWKREKQKTNDTSKYITKHDASTSANAKQTKTKERNKKDARQKNCRHLTTTAGGSSRSASRITRVLKRLSLRNIMNTRDMNVAYGMGIAASLSYWDFHKKPLPENRTHLEIMSYRNAPINGGVLEPLRRRHGHRRSRALRLVVSSVRLALDQANPWFSLLPSRRIVRRRQPKHNNDATSRPYSYWPLERISGTSVPTTTTASFRDILFDDPTAWKNQHRQHQIQLEYSLYNWYEPTPLGNYHDTDLLVATSNNGQNLILAFAGTASVFDTVTSLQTFEAAQHSGFFHNKTLEGGIHRGFLNAYSRVERGSILKLCHEKDCNIEMSTSLQRRYGHCVADGNTQNSETPRPSAERSAQAEEDNNRSINTTETITWKRGRGCKIKHRNLMTILRELVVDYLSAGKSVHLTGHSLGGSIATLHALDIIINFPTVPVTNLELWTFGGAQVVDDAFLQSALAVAPRLKHFVQQDSIMGNLNLQTVHAGAATSSMTSPRSQFHRFVTVSDDCKVDFVSTVAQKTLTPLNDRNIHGKTARKLGGIRGSVVHLVDPHYLLTPDQYDVNDEQFAGATNITTRNLDSTKKKETQQSPVDHAKESSNPNLTEDPSSTEKQSSSTKSTLAAHSFANYLKGISRESRDHPLSTDLPEEVRKWLGEIML